MAELGADDDAVTFFQRADTALYRAKEAGKGRIVGVGEPRSPSPRAAQERQVGRQVEDVRRREVVPAADGVRQQRRLAGCTPANDGVAPRELLERGGDRRRAPR